MKQVRSIFKLLSLMALYITFTAFGCDGGISGGNRGSSSGSDGGSSGQGGSLAQITIVGDYLYDLSVNKLSTVRLLTDGRMQRKGSIELPFIAETIFPFGEYLLIGARDGSYIYSITNPEDPTYVSHYQHVQACDPVVAQDNRAYVTLRSATQCRAVNELHILDIEQIESPKRIIRRSMENPHGLGIDQEILMVCEAHHGVSVLDVEYPNRIHPIATLETEAYDVILKRDEKIALLLGRNSLIQYDYANIHEIKKISDYEMLQP